MTSDDIQLQFLNLGLLMNSSNDQTTEPSQQACDQSPPCTPSGELYSTAVVVRGHWSSLLLFIFVAVGITGNSLVCIAISVEKKLHSVTSCFLVSLAVADLFVSLVVMPCCIVQEFMGYWPFGLVICNIWQMSDVVMCTSSIMHMCTISMDRYSGIHDPLKNRHRSKSVVVLKMGAVWVSSFLIASPLIGLGALRPEQILNTDGQCAISNAYYLVYGSLTAFFAPLLVMLVAFSLTVRLLNRQASQLGLQSEGGMRRCKAGRKPLNPSVEMKIIAPFGLTTAIAGNRTRLSTMPASDGGPAGSGRAREDSSDESAVSPCATVKETLKNKTLGKSSNARGSRSALAELLANGAKTLPKSERERVRSKADNAGANWLRRMSVKFSFSSSSLDGHHVSIAAANSNPIDGTVPGDRPGRLEPAPDAPTSRCQPKRPTVLSRFQNSTMSFCGSDSSAASGGRRKEEDESSPLLSGQASEQSSQPINRLPLHLMSRYDTTKNTSNDKNLVRHLPSKENITSLALKHATTSTARNLLPMRDELDSTSGPSSVADKLHNPETLSEKESDYRGTSNLRPPRKYSSNLCELRRSDDSGRSDSSDLDETTDAAITCSEESELLDMERRSKNNRGCKAQPPATNPASSRNGDAIMTSSNYASDQSGASDDVENEPVPNTRPWGRLWGAGLAGGQNNGGGGASMVGGLKFKSLVHKHGAAFQVAGMLRAKREDRQKSAFNSVKTERKAVKVLGTMFVIFFVSWAPFFSANLMMGLCQSCEIDMILFKFFLWLGYASSTLNPIIYTVFNRAFRDTFVRLLRCESILHSSGCWRNRYGSSGGLAVNISYQQRDNISKAVGLCTRLRVSKTSALETTDMTKESYL